MLKDYDFFNVDKQAHIRAGVHAFQGVQASRRVSTDLGHAAKVLKPYDPGTLQTVVAPSSARVTVQSCILVRVAACIVVPRVDEAPSQS